VPTARLKSCPFKSVRRLERLKAREDREDDVEGGHEEHADDGATDEDHEDPAEPEGNAVVGLDGVVGERIAQELASVERGDGEQIEDQEGEVDFDGSDAEQNDGLDVGVDAIEDLAVEGVEHDVAAAGRGCVAGYGVTDDEQKNKCQQSEDEIGDWSGEGDKVFVATNLVEVSRQDGRGFGPADESSAEHGESDEGAKDGDGRDEQAADDIDVIHGVEGDAAFIAGGVIAEARGHPGVGALVETEREDDDDEFKDGERKS